MYLLPGTRLFRVPDELPAELAALTELLAVTNGLDTARLLAGSGGGFTFGASVAVLGAGPLGLMHLAKAELLGAGRLLAVDPLPARLEHARGFGAEVSLDASALDRGERLAALREATGGLGPGLVVSCPGTPETFSEAGEAGPAGGPGVGAGR